MMFMKRSKENYEYVHKTRVTYTALQKFIRLQFSEKI